MEALGLTSSSPLLTGQYGQSSGIGLAGEVLVQSFGEH